MVMPFIPVDDLTLSDLLQVHFVGDTGRMDPIRIAALSSAPLVMRPAVVYAWLKVLKNINPA